MINQFKQHRLAYAVLILFMALAGFLFLAVWPDRIYQRYLILVMMAFYFFWGLVTHFKTDKLNSKIFLEYLGVSLLAGLLLFLVTV
jgi:FtsH-binding integral membrane protein